MPEYKLIYFDARGRAEIIRWIFAYAGIPFTDERVTREQWEPMKSTIPFGKLPCLMIDGKPLPQSHAIARYLAKQYGLAPEDSLKAAYADAVVDTVIDVAMELFRSSQKTDEAEKKKAVEETMVKTVGPAFGKLEKRLADGCEWIVGDKISWADLMISSIVGDVADRYKNILDAYPKLAAHVKKIRALPKIKAWIEKRPKTEF